MRRLPVASVDLGGQEERYVLDALRSSWISSTGAYLDRFEREFAALCGTRGALAVCNGTVALHLALLSMDLRPGDEVLVPSLTYVATANAVRYCGAEPVFVDVDPNTWCIDPVLLEGAITRSTKGIVAVHLYGHPADMDAIQRVADTHGLWVVEDAAESHGARYKGRPTGGLARAGAFSFYGNKLLTSGEGGALTVDDPSTLRRARALRGQGVDPDRRYFFPIVGYNYRLTNVAAAILCGQMERFDAILARRRAIFSAYRAALQGVPGIGFQPVAPWAEPSPWLFCVTVDEAAFGCSRDALAARLAKGGVETRPFFVPLHTLPPYRRESRARGDRLPRTERLAASGINLPTYNTLTDDDVAHVADSIRRVHA
jgi:perosamine synthetase